MADIRLSLTQHQLYSSIYSDSDSCWASVEDNHEYDSMNYDDALNPLNECWHTWQFTPYVCMIDWFHPSFHLIHCINAYACMLALIYHSHVIRMHTNFSAKFWLFSAYHIYYSVHTIHHNISVIHMHGFIDDRYRPYGICTLKSLLKHHTCQATVGRNRHSADIYDIWNHLFSFTFSLKTIYYDTADDFVVVPIWTTYQWSQNFHNRIIFLFLNCS